MSISRLATGLVSTAAVASALVVSNSWPALAETWSETPSVVSAELLSADGAGCSQPAVRLTDGWLDVQAQTGGDVSLGLDGGAAVGQHGVDVECLLRVRIQFDQQARMKARQYLMSGSVRTSAGTQAGHYFESSFDSSEWYGQRTTLPAGETGPFYRGGGSHFDPWSTCATETDLFIRVGLSLSSPDGLSGDDAVALNAPDGAGIELVADSNGCS
jgi:hypothetical protein